jgi:hypothetical protein
MIKHNRLKNSFHSHGLLVGIIILIARLEQTSPRLTQNDNGKTDAKPSIASGATCTTVVELIVMSHKQIPTRRRTLDAQLTLFIVQSF